MGLVPKIRGRKAILPGGIVAILAIIIGWILSHLGGGLGSGGGASGSGTSPVKTTGGGQNPVVQVVVREDGYYVDDKPLTLSEVLAAAGPSVAGPPVKIIGGPDSRMGAERDLENAFNTAHIPWVAQDSPPSLQ
jgi:hypothetical protein